MSETTAITFAPIKGLTTPLLQESLEGFNAIYGLPIALYPTTDALAVPRHQQLADLKKVLTDEVNEIDDIPFNNEETLTEDQLLDHLTGVADLLGDLCVFAHTEAIKWGIPLDKVLGVIMQSNRSKLGADGQPILDENRKVQKGPNYWKPEPKIKELLREKREWVAERGASLDGSDLNQALTALHQAMTLKDGRQYGKIFVPERQPKHSPLSIRATLVDGETRVDVTVGVAVELLETELTAQVVEAPYVPVVKEGGEVVNSDPETAPLPTT